VVIAAGSGCKDPKVFRAYVTQANHFGCDVEERGEVLGAGRHRWRFFDWIARELEMPRGS